jgi:hypothetical protein
MALKKLITILLFSLTVALFAQNSTTPDSSNVKILQSAEPDYPDNIAVKKLKGKITFEILVLPDDSFKIISVRDSVPELYNLALNALNKYTFSAATKNNASVSSKIAVEITFPPKSYIDRQNKLNDDPALLKKQMLDFIQNKKLHNDSAFFNNFYYPVQIHYKGTLFKSQIYKNEHFIEYNPFFNDNLLYQNYLPLYQFNILNNQNSLSNNLTSFKPMLISSNMGMGEFENQFAILNFNKNDALNIDNLNISGTFIGHDGLIPRVSEKASNSVINLNWKFKDFSVNSNLAFFNQNYSSRQINDYQFYINPEDVMTEVSSDQKYSLQYKFLYTAYRIRDQKVKSYGNDKINYQNNDIVFGLSDSLFFQKFNLAFQNTNSKYLKKYSSLNKYDDNYSLLNLDHKLYLYKIEANNNLISYFKNNTLIYSGNILFPLSNKIKTGLSLKYQNKDIPDLFDEQYLEAYDSSQMAALLNYSGKYYSLKSETGLRNRTQTYHILQNITLKEKYLFCKLENSLNLPFKNQNIIISHLCEYQNTKTLYYNNELLSKLRFVIEHPMPRDNKISAGFDYYFASNFIDPQNNWAYNNILDTFVKINITKLFDFTVSVSNITSTQSYLTEELNPYNFNAGLTWYFLN